MLQYIKHTNQVDWLTTFPIEHVRLNQLPWETSACHLQPLGKQVGADDLCRRKLPRQFRQDKARTAPVFDNGADGFTPLNQSSRGGNAPVAGAKPKMTVLHGEQRLEIVRPVTRRRP